MKHSYTICPHCGCGCGLYLVRQDGSVGGVTASLNHPFNQGQLCARGWTCHQLPNNPARIAAPLVRSGESLTETTWDKALDFAANKLKTVREAHGPESIGVIASPRLTTTEMFALRSLARDVLGTPHYDSGARLVGYPFEFPKTAAMADLATSDLIVVIGANLLEDNPILGAKILSLCKPAADRPYVSPDIAHVIPAAPIPLAVIGSRKSTLGDIARPFIKPRPGSEPQLLAALLKSLIENRHLTSGDSAFAKLKENLSKHSVNSLLDGAGVAAAQSLESLSAQLAKAKAPLLVIGRDLFQTPGADTALAALANLTLIFGDRLSVLPAATGANEYAARRILSSPDGMGYLEMIDALRRKKLHALVLAGEDPLRVLPGRDEVAQALGNAEYILAIESFKSPLYAHAHAVLPLALPMEKTGSFFTMDGIEQSFVAAVKPAGHSLPLDKILGGLTSRFQAKPAHDKTMSIGKVNAIDPMRSYEIPKTSDQIVLELGSVYP
ncbi:MAG: molybdopterin-dependent oxidoreductase, partial [Candidatus Edwardsbacteria bacterium]|nr:molybdopterin-dependent oxidoreductase [Candidatus Edwardsbacteria bacterium]